jgi:hypothetical protein
MTCQDAPDHQPGGRNTSHSQQGDCKNAFCQGILPGDKITIVKPLIRDPDTKKGKYWLLKHALYRLRHSPWHWHNKICAIITQLGLRENASDPYLFTVQVVDPLDPTVPAMSLPLTLGLYIDNFFYFSEDPVIEWKFEALLSQLITVEFMGQLNGSLAYTFNCLSRMMSSLFTSARWDSPPISLKKTTSILAM